VRIRRRTATIGAVVAAGLAVAFVLAFAVSPHASSKPDGLEKVAAAQGLGAGAHTRTGLLSVSTGLAGVIGVAVTFAIGLGLFVALRAVRRRTT